MAAPTPALTRPAGDRSATILLTLGGLIGLIVRYPMLFYMGVFDMNAYYDWGKRSIADGLPIYYHGIYFPFQYQIFEVCAWIVARSGWDFVPVFKASNLVFDVGSFWVLILLLRRLGLNPAYALLYWLHPWFLSVFSLGYIDFHFTFFVLLTVYLLRRETTRDYLVAGSPLAFAFLMKPQAQILVIATFMYGVFHYVRRRDVGPLCMMAAPIILFVGYEAYFTASRFSGSLYEAGRLLPDSYLTVTNVMPALTAQMTNLWYPIAYFMKEPGDQIYAISDQIHPLPYIQARHLAAAVVLTLVGMYVFRVHRAAEPLITDKFVRIFGFATVAVPFIMTSAHENHLFLGSVFLVLLTAALPLSFKVASHILLMVQFANIYGLYGDHPQWLAGLLRDAFNLRYMPLSYSLISIACFLAILGSIWRARKL
jgi:hypothetical protein